MKKYVTSKVAVLATFLIALLGITGGTIVAAHQPPGTLEELSAYPPESRMAMIPTLAAELKSPMWQKQIAQLVVAHPVWTAIQRDGLAWISTQLTSEYFAKAAAVSAEKTRRFAEFYSNHPEWTQQQKREAVGDFKKTLPAEMTTTDPLCQKLAELFPDPQDRKLFKALSLGAYAERDGSPYTAALWTGVIIKKLMPTTIVSAEESGECNCEGWASVFCGYCNVLTQHCHSNHCDLALGTEKCGCFSSTMCTDICQDGGAESGGLEASPSFSPSSKQ